MEIRFIWKKYTIMGILRRAGMYMLCMSIVLLSGCGNERVADAGKFLDYKMVIASTDSSGDNYCDEWNNATGAGMEADITEKAEADTQAVIVNEPDGTMEPDDTKECEVLEGIEEETHMEVGTELNVETNQKADSTTAIEEVSASESVCYVDEYANQALVLINEQREAEGLAPLSMNNTLISAAQVRAKELIQNFSHTRPDGSSCFSAFNVPYSGAAENIAAGQWSPEWVVDSWMNSEEHRANIMDARYTQAAIVCVYAPDSSYEYYWVQLFIG